VFYKVKSIGCEVGGSGKLGDLNIVCGSQIVLEVDCDFDE
jgi:hypothetical protein